MRLAICGTDKIALKIKNIFDNISTEDVEIVMFVGPPSKETKNPKIPVVSEEGILETDYSKVLDGFIISPEYYGLVRMDIYKKIKSSIYANKQIFMPDFETLQYSESAELIETKKLLIPYEESSQLFYLEVHAADHCNLNCKGCMHFSNLVKDHVYPDFNRLANDIKQLKKIINHIDIIRILGGEPLLNPELEQYIILLRKTYPFANINIVTNGILVEKMSAALCKVIRENKVHVRVSLYPPLMKKKNSIENFLKDNKIIYRISECIETFTSTYQMQPHIDKNYAKEHCEIFCNNLRDGKMGCCPNIIYTHYFNERFDTKLPFEDGMIDIYKIRSAKELHECLRNPVELCSYCDRSVNFNWELSKKQQTEWLSTAVKK